MTLQKNGPQIHKVFLIFGRNMKFGGERSGQGLDGVGGGERI